MKLFNDKNKIRDDSYYSNNGFSFKPVAAIVGVVFVASLMMKDANRYDIKNYIKDLFDGHLGDDSAEIYRPETKNEMFCPAPGQEVEKLDYFTQDPFEDIMFKFQNDFSYFWISTEKHKTLSFEFMKEATQTSDHEKWFETIPQSVIDDPTVTFILSGHASYDLDEKYGVGNGIARLPENFDAIEERHTEVNKRYVEARLDYVENKLIDLGISKDRIITRNYGHRFDKRAVDIEVCMPDDPDTNPDTNLDEHNM